MFRSRHQNYLMILHLLVPAGIAWSGCTGKGKPPMPPADKGPVRSSTAGDLDVTVAENGWTAERITLATMQCVERLRNFDHCSCILKEARQTLSWNDFKAHPDVHIVGQTEEEVTICEETPEPPPPDTVRADRQNSPEDPGPAAPTTKSAAGWTGPQFLKKSNLFNATQPDFTGNGRGQYLAIWKWEQDQKSEIRSRYFDGDQWQDSLPVDQSGRLSEYPAVAMDDSGRACAVWQTVRDGMFIIMGNTFTPGNGWGDPVKMDHQPGVAGHPFITMDADGRGRAVWHQQITPSWSYAVVTSVCDPVSGAFSPPRVISRDTEVWNLTPRASFGRSGEGIIVWKVTGRNSSLPGHLVMASVLQEDSWSQPFEVTDAISRSSVKQVNSAPEIALHDVNVRIDTRGSAWVVFQNAQMNYRADRLYRTRIFIARVHLAENRADPAVLLSSGATNAMVPEVSSNDAGRIMVVWREKDGQRRQTISFATRDPRSEEWSSAARINPRDLSTSWYPDLSVDSNGRFIAIWTQWNGERYDIRSATW